MAFQTFHKYNRLVRRELAQPLKHACGTEYTLRADENGDPLLQCFGCGAKVTPGLKMIEDVEAVVKEYFD